jgi:hypothetical protein
LKANGKQKRRTRDDIAELDRHYQAAREQAAFHSRSRQTEVRATPRGILAIISQPLGLPSLNTAGVSLGTDSCTDLSNKESLLLGAVVSVLSPPKTQTQQKSVLRS